MDRVGRGLYVDNDKKFAVVELYKVDGGGYLLERPKYDAVYRKVCAKFSPGVTPFVDVFGEVWVERNGKLVKLESLVGGVVELPEGMFCDFGELLLGSFMSGFRERL